MLFHITTNKDWEKAKKNDLIILAIDEELLKPEFKSEDLYNLNENYPHIYGTINLESVVFVEPFTFSNEGFILPQKISRLKNNDILSIKDLINMSIELWEENKENWSPMSPEYAKDSILYMIEEMCDVMMYYSDALNRFHIDEEEFSNIYIKKFKKNV